MQSWSDDNKALFDPVVMPSGEFTCGTSPIPFFSSNSLPQAQPESFENSQQETSFLYNPLPLTITKSVADEVPSMDGDQFLNEYRKSQSIKSINRNDFDDYALTLYADLVPSLIQSNHNLILFPLRGCRQPGILAKTMLGLPENMMVIFNYTYSTRDSQQDIITRQLKEQLEDRLPDSPRVSIGILDTAKGGYGSEHLAGILKSLHSTICPQQEWSVVFHLLHERQEMPTLAHSIPRHTDSKVVFHRPILHPVDSLLVEDWSDGIGLSVQYDGGFYHLKRCITPGRLIVRDSESIKVIESDSLSELVTSYVIDSLNRVMLDDESLRYVRDVCWPDSATSGYHEAK